MVEGQEHVERKLGNRRYLPQILAVMVKNLLLLAYGMTLGFPTIVIPAVKGDAQKNDTNPSNLIMTEDQVSWLGSINLVVVPLGCAFSGAFSQFFGRRRAMQLITFPFIISWNLFYFATNVAMVYVALILFGIAGGLMEASVLTYVAEVTEPMVRGILSGTSSLSIIVGVAVVFLLGTLMTWRQVALISNSVPVLAFILIFFIPESPYYLLTKYRLEEAKKSLAWLRGWVKVDDIMDEYNLLYNRIIENTNKGNGISLNSSTWRDKVKPYTQRNFIMPFILVSLAFLIGHFNGMTTLQTYAVEIFDQLQAPIDKYKATSLLGIMEVIGCFICITLIHYTGKRSLTFVSNLGCGLCFGLTATYSYFLPKLTENSVLLSNNHTALNETFFTAVTEEKNYYTWIPTALLLFSALLSHSGIRALPWILIGEVFPSKVRATGAGFSAGMGYIFGFLANKLFYSMRSLLTLHGTFWFYSGTAAVGTIVLYYLLPETEGRTLLEIEDHFNRRINLTDKAGKVNGITVLGTRKLSCNDQKVNQVELSLLNSINRE